MDDTTTPLSGPAQAATASLSYKFERLREKLRTAVVSGEFSGKLPGERALSRRFHVNPKTLSKALSDLAAEGLLQRRVGQGTFVATDAPTPVGHWLILRGGEDSQPLLTELLRLMPESRCCDPEDALRPSTLYQVRGVISLRTALDSDVLHDLQVRGIPVLEATESSATFSTHGVIFDRQRAALEIGRRLLLAGHQHLCALDRPGRSDVREGLSLAAAQFNPSASVHPCSPQQVVHLALEGATAWVCDSLAIAEAAHHDLAQSVTLLLRDNFSIAAIDEQPAGEVIYSGYYLDPAEHARQIAQLLPSLQPHRRSLVYLRGEFADHATLRSPAQSSAVGSQQMSRSL